ncbi:MAG: hypothetical protein KKE59_09355, partial [Proteobacteria bacterium]|nr:hypothetical protein [Pseudomonadota bacterium]
INDEMTEAIANLNSSLNGIKERIEKMSGGDGRMNEELYLDIKTIADQANSVSHRIQNDLMQELKSISESTKQMAEYFDRFRDTITSGEAKKGFFMSRAMVYPHFREYQGRGNSPPPGPRLFPTGAKVIPHPPLS